MNEKKELKTYFSIKYVVTRGIQMHDECYLTDDGQYVTNDKGMFDGKIFERLGRDIFATREEAVAAGKQSIINKQIRMTRQERKLARLLRELK